MLAVHRPVLLDLRRIAGHVLEDVYREDDVQGNQSEIPLQFLMAVVQFDHDCVVGSDRGVAAEHPLRHLRALPRLHRINAIARTLRQGDDLVRQAFTSVAPRASQAGRPSCGSSPWRSPRLIRRNSTPSRYLRIEY